MRDGSSTAKASSPSAFVDGIRIQVRVLSILDDHSRAVLAGVVAKEENTEATIRVFDKAVTRWGLADRFQFDRGSAFDSHAFRGGLAALGVHRNFIEARSPEWDGKIEAYHRSLERWFVVELRSQQVSTSSTSSSCSRRCSSWSTTDITTARSARHRTSGSPGGPRSGASAGATSSAPSSSRRRRRATEDRRGAAAKRKLPRALGRVRRTTQPIPLPDPRVRRPGGPRHRRRARDRAATLRPKAAG